MRAERVLIAPLACLLCVAAFGCEPAPVCGDGVVGRGETEASCCLDTGCGFGACDSESRRCVDPWLIPCAGAESCLASGPYRCAGTAPPTYDCEACGCPDDGRCEAGVCWTLDEIRARRDEPEIDTNLDEDVYFALVEALERAPLTLDALVDEVLPRVREDARHSALLLGLAAGSARERALVLELQQRLEDRGLDTVPDVVSLLAAERAAACVDVAAQAGARLAADGVLLVQGDAADTHRETCFFEGLWPRCGPPTLEGCVLDADRLPLTLLLVDFQAALDDVDRALLIRATNRPVGERLFHLDQAIARWRQSIDTWSTPEAFEVSLGDERLVVRAARSERYEDTWWVSVPARGKVAWGLVGFRLLWNDAATRAFFAEHDIVGRDCEWSLDEGEAALGYVCENDGARVEALIDTGTQVISSLTRLPPP